MWYYNSLNQYCFIFQGVTYFVKGKFTVLRDCLGEEVSRNYFSQNTEKIQRKRKNPKFCVKWEFLYLTM